MDVGTVKGKGMMKLCLSSTCSFSLPMCPHPWLTHVSPRAARHLTAHPSPPRYSWQFPQGRRHLCPFTLASTWEDPGRQRCGGEGCFHRSLGSWSPEQVQGKEPSEVTSCSVQTVHPDNSLLPAWHPYVTPPGLPCPFPCRITACV